MAMADVSRISCKPSQTDVPDVFDLTILEREVSAILDKVEPSRQKVLFVLNKADVLTEGEGMSAGFGMTMDENGGFVLPDSYNKKVSILNLIVSVINNQSEKYNIRDASLVLVSAKKGEGIDALKNALSCLCREYAADTDATIVTNLRHVEALQCASDALVRVRQGLASEIPTDLVSQDIREALYYLGSIVGEISTDEVLGRIFEGFCIGK